MRVLLSSVAAFALLVACNGEPGEMAEDAADAMAEAAEEAVEAVEELAGGVDETVEEALAAPTLEQVLADPRRQADRARDQYRNPRETLEFFGVEPSDTVVEALPGGGWYGRILAPWLAAEGRYYGLNYPMSVFEQLFGNMTDEARTRLEGWEVSFPGMAAEWGGPAQGGYRFGAIPDSAAGSADVVLYIRALHNLAAQGQLGVAVDDAWMLLKPGGVVGLVQHRAPASETDERADGSRGYMREADLIAAFEARGFVLEASSEINANPNDPADYDQGVWALPPSLRDLTDEQREANLAIGESDRMTLRFRKPQ